MAISIQNPQRSTAASENGPRKGSARHGTVGHSPIPDLIAAILPLPLSAEILRCVGQGERIEEIRLRRGRRASLTVAGENRLLAFVSEGETMERILLALCDGALYAHSEQLKEGYVTLRGGIRVGVAGRAVVTAGRVERVYDVSALNLRLPTSPFVCGEPIARLLRMEGREGGVLVYSPPGEGKTTLLRGVLLQLAAGKDALRCAVIDTRDEVMAGLEHADLLIDSFCGYPKAIGMEIALRCMSPQLLVCDELGEGEAETVLAAQNAGVPLLATAHGASLREMLFRPGIAKLHLARAFDAYVGIRRVPRTMAFRYEITEWEEANELLQRRGESFAADGGMAMGVSV